MPLPMLNATRPLVKRIYQDVFQVSSKFGWFLVSLSVFYLDLVSFGSF